MTPFEFWRDGHGVEHITPPDNKSPETEEFFLHMQNVVYAQDMLEVGCGVGRLAPYFSKLRYRGIDISEKAIEKARRDHPGYKFEVDDGVGTLNFGLVAIAHTVALHIPDDKIQDFANRFQQVRVIVSEILGRNWRREGSPPVFNREINEYDEIFLRAGYRCHRVNWFEYPHYPDTDIAVMEFHRK